LAQTIIHIFIAYLLQPLSRNRLNVAALMIGAAIPDMESAFYAIQASQFCTTAQCVADWPSHMLFHSFLGLFIIVAPLAAASALWLGSKGWKGWKLAYLSAFAGGLLHALTDMTGHAASDAVHLLWPSTAGFSIGLPLGLDTILLEAAALLGLAIFLAKETKHFPKLRFWK